eukprot:scaffold14560_cov60-Phaeocystis_antarctica.AAC.7
MCARLLNVQRHFIHRPYGMLTVGGVVAGLCESLCLIEPSRNVPVPRWNVTSARSLFLAGWRTPHRWHSNADQHQCVL